MTEESWETRGGMSARKPIGGLRRRGHAVEVSPPPSLRHLSPHRLPELSEVRKELETDPRSQRCKAGKRRQEPAAERAPSGLSLDQREAHEHPEAIPGLLGEHGESAGRNGVRGAWIWGALSNSSREKSWEDDTCWTKIPRRAMDRSSRSGPKIVHYAMVTTTTGQRGADVILLLL